MEKCVKELDVLFNPSSVAVVGATKNTNKAGHVILKNFVENNRRGVFRGEIYPVNPNEDCILGFHCYSNLKEISGKVDLP